MLVFKKAGLIGYGVSFLSLSGNSAKSSNSKFSKSAQAHSFFVEGVNYELRRLQRWSPLA